MLWLRPSSASRKQRTLRLDSWKYDCPTCNTKSPWLRSSSTHAGVTTTHFCAFPFGLFYPVDGDQQLIFFSICRLYDEDAGEAVRLCEALLEEPELDPAVKIGDAYGFLVEHHCQQGNFQVVTDLFCYHLQRHITSQITQPPYLLSSSYRPTGSWRSSRSFCHHRTSVTTSARRAWRPCRRRWGYRWAATTSGTMKGRKMK